MEDLSRRELLVLGTAAASAVALPGLGASSAAAAGSLSGRVVRPGDPAYEAARTDWDMLFSHYPQAIVFCRNERDVANAIAWARKHDIAVRARSGRHNLEGWSNLDGGLVIDVSQIKGVAIDRKARTATIGAGMTQGEVMAALGPAGFAIPTGSEASVGAVGATLGGGFGFLTRALGLACDNLLSAGIVVPTGRREAKLLTAGPHTHAELLWACRGGGGGNFGIVTSLTYRIHRVKNVAFVLAKWPQLSSLPRVFDAWQRTAPRADRRLTSVLEVDPSSLVLYAVLIGASEAEARRRLHPLLSIDNPTVSVTVDSWAKVFASFNSGPRQYANWKFYSQFVTRPFPARAINIVRQFMQAAPSPPSNFFCSSFGGAVAHEPAGGSAFAHRDALFYAEPGAGWNGSGLNTACQGWVAEFGKALHRYVDGAYVNVPNAAMAGWPHAYYGSKYPRLRRIKARYDPTNFFQFEQSVESG